jgi:hypothetical protein
MLPARTSKTPRSSIAAEVRVPDEGSWCAAQAREVRADAVVLSMVRGLPVGTRVIVALSTPDGQKVVDGIVDHNVDDQSVDGVVDHNSDVVRVALVA